MDSRDASASKNVEVKRNQTDIATIGNALPKTTNTTKKIQNFKKNVEEKRQILPPLTIHLLNPSLFLKIPKLLKQYKDLNDAVKDFLRIEYSSAIPFVPGATNARMLCCDSYAM